MCGNIHLLDPTYNGKQIAGYSRFSWVLIKRMLILLTYMLLQNKYSFSCLWHDGPSCHTSDAATCNIELFSMDCTRNNFVKTKVPIIMASKSCGTCSILKGCFNIWSRFFWSVMYGRLGFRSSWSKGLGVVDWKKQSI